MYGDSWNCACVQGPCPVHDFKQTEKEQHEADVHDVTYNNGDSYREGNLLGFTSQPFVPPVKLTINERWEKGVEHDPRSVAIFEGISKIDFEECGDYFCWKSGGDGDNGETLMYLLDVYFEKLGAQ